MQPKKEDISLCWVVESTETLSPLTNERWCDEGEYLVDLLLSTDTCRETHTSL